MNYANYAKDDGTVILYGDDLSHNVIHTDQCLWNSMQMKDDLSATKKKNNGGEIVHAFTVESRVTTHDNAIREKGIDPNSGLRKDMK